MEHSKQFLRIVDKAKSKIKETTIEQVKLMLNQKEDFVLIDIREESEWNKEKIPGSFYLGKGKLEHDIVHTIPDASKKIVLYSGGGYRSALSALNLKKMGYKNVYSMSEGINGWISKGFETIKGRIIDVHHTILYVEDLSKSKMFYELLFQVKPFIEEESIAEFRLNESAILGLMKKNFTEKMFTGSIPERYKNKSSLLSELYFESENAEELHLRSLQLGSLELSPFSERSWGHSVGYSINHDTAILAFAKPTN